MTVPNVSIRTGLTAPFPNGDSRPLLRLAEPKELAVDESSPDHTLDTYAKSWRVWERFCSASDLSPAEGSHADLVAFVTWMLREGRQKPSHGGTMGYAPASAGTHLAATVVGLRRRGIPVSAETQAEARRSLEDVAAALLETGELRGRGQSVAADIDGLYAIAASCPETLTGHRDKALILTGFHYAERASEPARLLAGDVAVHPRGLAISVPARKTQRSVRSVEIPHSNDTTVCPVRAWSVYRAQLRHLHGDQYDVSSTPAFVGIDRWGNVTGGMCPDSVTRAIKRISARAGVPVSWTSISLRSRLTRGRLS
ncbi:integrase [Streptomyces sp. NPDC055140]